METINETYTKKQLNQKNFIFNEYLRMETLDHAQ